MKKKSNYVSKLGLEELRISKYLVTAEVWNITRFAGESLPPTLRSSLIVVIGSTHSIMQKNVCGSPYSRAVNLLHHSDLIRTHSNN